MITQVYRLAILWKHCLAELECLSQTKAVTTAMALITKFRGMGEAMGLKGDSLTQYVQNNVEKREERERQAAREREERQAEREERERAAAYEREERAAAREREERLELAKLQVQKDVELARLQAEAERSRVGYGGDLSDSRDSSTGLLRGAPLRRVISMPNFNEKEDLVESFLSQFEKLASIHGVPKEQWVINVSAFLLGSAK